MLRRANSSAARCSGLLAANFITGLGRSVRRRREWRWRRFRGEKTLAEPPNPGTYAGGWCLQMRLAAYRTGSGLCCEKSIMTDLMKALRERREQLRNDLLEDAVFQEYDLVCRLLERHEASVAQPSSPRRKAPPRQPPPPQEPINRPAPFTRIEKGMSAVIEASADYLREKGARAASAEIQEELVRRGILAASPGDRSKITSYLGRAKKVFDNVRGEGYGLIEWRTPSG